ncbi:MULTISPECIES: orotidine-5'-phosphate decarboxylase [Carnobacterium]|uniref:Orotidine 5'-phosphate decarboxylase n=1 Tax=Carnobacterium inhibens TaxID=147709 RepID=A0ABR7TAB9_9LACT|nr:orotidine-5'-phosphate decarboxylase [Carnobacterium inhibens]MBC9824900.1 orotidine-5'-phosphate decarboxylase [Carnobacterium inhibens]MCM3512471.1 orotidine-5'-phosphate decarboxylase [Carnobacterium inhibens]
MTNKPIIALDFPTVLEAKDFLSHFDNEPLFVKVGMELFYQNGPEIVTMIKNSGHDVFLDLKLHDIPNTVYRSMKGLASLGIDMVNVHAAGGQIMMEAALEGLIAGTNEGKKRPKLIAVTQLTSTTEVSMQQEQLISASLMESVVHYAKLTHMAGLDGVVCSALEALTIKQQTSNNFLCVTPGIRPEGTDSGDQKRVATPAVAKKEGASYIVVGRPITQAEDPVHMYHAIKEQWNGVGK